MQTPLRTLRGDVAAFLKIPPGIDAYRFAIDCRRYWGAVAWGDALSKWDKRQ